MLMKVLRTDPNYFSFLSGIFVSAGINLLTGILSTDQLPRRWPYLIVAAIFAVASSIAWAVLAWELTTIGRLAIADAPGFVSSENAWTKLATGKQWRLFLALGTALLCAIFGIAALFFGY